MRLAYNSIFRKISGLLRYFLARVYYLKSLRASGLGLIGKDCGIHILEQGRMSWRGRIAINDHSMLYAKGNLEIGANFYVNKYASIIAHEAISIGDNVSVGQFTTILDHDHAYHREGENIRFEGFHTAPVRIGNNVWIANHCNILRGVTIGDNVVVGANTLIHKDVPPNCVVMGVPFKIVKKI